MSKFDHKYLIIAVLVVAVASAFSLWPSDAGVPPTPAIQKVNVDTSPWFGTDTWVNATTSNDVIYLVSDGSIIFNVTSTAP